LLREYDYSRQLSLLYCVRGKMSSGEEMRL
jgi:hypothetical protein